VLVASLALAGILGVAALGAAGAWRVVPALPEPAVAAAPLAVPSTPAPEVAEAPPLRLVSRTVRVGQDQTFAQALVDLGLDGAQSGAVVAALQGQLDFSRLRPGGQVRVERVEGEKALRRLSYRQGPADEWIVERVEGGTLAAHKRPVEVTTQVARVTVEIESSLSEALSRAGEDPSLAVLASDVLAWDVDFYQDVRRGDRMTVLVDKVYADGRLLRLGEIHAVEYQGDVARRRLYQWTDPEGAPGYYDDEGTSAKRGFLKSPLKFAHLTSRFGSRTHPVLGYRKAHEGIDYGAPVGTPVWAVGDGTVTHAGWHGGCGKTVIVRHKNGYSTQYCHLSQIAVAAGARVAQKQVIGAVGQTGLATGPHLHFAVKRGSGGFMNPLALKLPRDAPVPERWKPEFEKAVAPLRAQLVQGNVVMQ
jgi:murein DD-endopeptidase MepM/ murein hydrolase activator NlpD